MNMQDDALSRSSNPLLGTQHAPSGAYMRSLSMRKMDTADSLDSTVSSQSGHVESQHYMPIIGAILLLVGGLIIFMIGASYFWSFDGEGQKSHGFDLLLIGGTMLLPGLYGTIGYYGAWQGWRGFDYSSMRRW